MNRTQQLIELCDQKTELLLVIYGIMIPLLINNNVIIEKLIKLVKTTQINIYSVLTFVVLISLTYSIYNIIQVFKARTDNKLNDSIIYFKDISNKDFTNFKKTIVNMDFKELIDDIIQQIYVNSVICNKKYVHFDKALHSFVFFIISYFLLYIFLLMG